MDTQRTAQIVAWTIIGAVVGPLVSVLGLLYCRSAALGPATDPSPVLAAILIFAFIGAFGMPPGIVGGFLMGLFVAPVQAFAWQLFWATAIGFGVGIGYGTLLTNFFEDPQMKSFLLTFSTTAGGAGGFLMPLAVGAVRKSFER